MPRRPAAVVAAAVDAVVVVNGELRLELAAYVPLYRAFGFRDVEAVVLTMPDGVTIEGVAMERPIDPP